MAYTSTNADNVQLGTCSVLFDTVDLGLTKGGVEVSISTMTYKISVDQFGATEINEYITGRTCLVKVPMAETDLTLLAKVIPDSTLVTVSLTKKIKVKTSTGKSLRNFAGVLTLHPIALGSTAKNNDFNVPIAAPKGEFNFAYKIDEERIYNVEFQGYPDLATDILYVIGDASVVG